MEVLAGRASYQYLKGADKFNLGTLEIHELI